MLATLPPRWAALFAALLVVAAIGMGLTLGTIARPAPTPTPTPTPPPATPTPVPTTDPAVFRQPLASGCATEQSVWVVTNGGTLIRYDGEHWSQADSTLRSLTHAVCEAFLVYAVGPAGAALVIDDRARTIQSIDISNFDLLGASPLPDGVLVAGAQGTVLRLAGGEWHPYAAGIDEDLRAVVAFDALSAWVVGAGGVSYRLEPAGWRPVATGVDVTLRAVSGPNVRTVIAAGDAGTLLVFAGTQWVRVESGVTTTLRAATHAGSRFWVVGDRGVVLRLDGVTSPGIPPRPYEVGRVDIGTTCDLRGVWARGDDLWIVGSAGASGAVWRLRNGAVAERWGAC